MGLSGSEIYGPAAERLTRQDLALLQREAGAGTDTIQLTSASQPRKRVQHCGACVAQRCQCLSAERLEGSQLRIKITVRPIVYTQIDPFCASPLTDIKVPGDALNGGSVCALPSASPAQGSCVL